MGIKSKIASIVALTALTTSVLAGGPEPAPAVPVCGPFDGFYLGMIGGWSRMKVRDHMTSGLIAPDGFRANFGGAFLKKAGSAFAFGGVFGYGTVFNNDFYFGAEMHVAYHDEHASGSYTQVVGTSLEPVATRYNENWDWGVDLMPGYVYNSKFLFYGKIGYRGSRLIIKTALSRFNPAAVPTTVINPAFSTAHYIHGANVGAGIKYAIYQNVNIWVEYDYTWYSHVNSTVRIDPNSPLDVASHVVRKDYQQALFGISYGLCD